MMLENMSEDEILRIANPIMDNLMDASTAIDHERHIRDFSERMKAIIIKEYLQHIRSKRSRRRDISPCDSRSPSSSGLAERRLSGNSGSPKRPVNSLPKCSWSKRTADSWSIAQWCPERFIKVSSLLVEG